MVTGQLSIKQYSTAYDDSSASAEEARQWRQTGPRSMTDWIAWQADWRLFDFSFLLEWGGQYGPALHEGQWWRWITWGGSPPIFPGQQSFVLVLFT